MSVGSSHADSPDQADPHPPAVIAKSGEASSEACESGDCSVMAVAAAAAVTARILNEAPREFLWIFTDLVWCVLPIFSAVDTGCEGGSGS